MKDRIIFLCIKYRIEREGDRGDSIVKCINYVLNKLLLKEDKK
jgi:hypothetical protein